FSCQFSAMPGAPRCENQGTGRQRATAHLCEKVPLALARVQGGDPRTTAQNERHRQRDSVPTAFHQAREQFMATKPNPQADIKNANKGTSGTNTTYDKA